jgi:hypothetical protein
MSIHAWVMTPRYTPTDRAYGLRIQWLSGGAARFEQATSLPLRHATPPDSH